MFLRRRTSAQFEETRPLRPSPKSPLLDNNSETKSAEGIHWRTSCNPQSVTMFKKESTHVQLGSSNFGLGRLKECLCYYALPFSATIKSPTELSQQARTSSSEGEKEKNRTWPCFHGILTFRKDLTLGNVGGMHCWRKRNPRHRNLPLQKSLTRRYCFS